MSARHPAELTDHALRTARILVVDDEASARSSLDRLLRHLGYTNIRLVADAAQALDEFTAFAPDLLITDLNMPRVSGEELVAAVRAALPPGEFLPILVLSGNADTHERNQVLLTGATDFLAKPFSGVEVSVRIRNLLQTRFQHREIARQNAELERQVAARTAELSRALAHLRASQRTLLQQERFCAFGELAGGVVHEFNNGLTAIVGYCDLLLQNPALRQNEARLCEYLGIVLRAGRDAAGSLGRLRDFTHSLVTDDGTSATDLATLIDQTIAEMEPTTAAATELVCAVSESAPAPTLRCIAGAA